MTTAETAETAETTGTATEDATRAAVQAFLGYRLTGDTEGLTTLFADEVDWLLAENPSVPWIRPRSTAAECAAQSVELAAHLVPDSAGATVDTLVVEGAQAVIFGRLWGTVHATGKSFEGPFALRLSVEDGRITRHHLYENSLSIADACAP